MPKYRIMYQNIIQKSLLIAILMDSLIIDEHSKTETTTSTQMH